MTAVEPAPAVVTPSTPAAPVPIVHYAVTDASGNIVGWYNTDIYPPNADGSENAAIPAAAVPLTAAQWQDCIDNNGLRQIVNGVPVAYTPPTAPPPPAAFTFLQFLALFTPSEQTAIVGSADPQVRLFLLMAAGATTISMGDQRTTNGLAYLVQQGLVTQARETAILASPPPAAS